MSNLDIYADYVSRIKKRTIEMIGMLDDSSIRVDTFGVTWEHVLCNIEHFLDVDTATASAIAADAVNEAAISSDLDHTAEFAPLLLERTDIVDPDSVLDGVRSGEQFLFAGFHTGPYWSIWQHLLHRGALVTAILPPYLFARSAELSHIAACCAGRSGGRIHFIEISDPRFMLKLRERVAAGDQILVYLDGFGGYRAPQNAKRDVTIDFLSVELTLKTTVSRLGGLLHLPIVPFNAARTVLPRRRLILEPAIRVSGDTDHASLLRRIYQTLAARLVLHPAQWEPWSYGHVFLSNGYLRRCSCRKGKPSARGSFFLMRDGAGTMVATDRLTYRSWRIAAEDAATIRA